MSQPSAGPPEDCPGLLTPADHKIDKPGKRPRPLQAPRRPYPEQFPQDQPQVACGDLEQVAFRDLGEPAQPTASAPARLAHVREAPFRQLAPPALQPLAARTPHPAPV